MPAFVEGAREKQQQIPFGNDKQEKQLQEQKGNCEGHSRCSDFRGFWGWDLEGGFERVVGMDLRELAVFGEMMDSAEAHPQLAGRSVAEFLTEALLKVRGKDGRLHPLRANVAQREFERRRGLGNIVLKARQMGMTTWVAARFLLKTITRPGTLTLQVAHTQDSAEEILRIVHRFVEHLPEGLKAGALRTAKANVKQIVFPMIDSEFRVVSAGDRNAGRGMTFQNLHCSEVSRWDDAGDTDAGEVLAGLRAGLSPGGEMVLESTPNGAMGCFYEQWRAAEELGLVRHFFPWWMDAGYSAVAADPGSLTEEEMELMMRPGIALTLEQVGYRRQLRAGLLGLARQEFAEDPERCFLVSGESYFELGPVDLRLATVDAPRRRAIGRLSVSMDCWYEPQPGRWYVVAVDPAGGGAEGDSSAVQVIDLESGLQCAEFAGHVGGIELMEIAREIGWDYNGAWLVVERNNHGAGLLSLLELKGYVRVYKGSDGMAGYLTTSVSRPAMLAAFSLALAEEPGLFQSRELLAECRSFVRLRSGNVGARRGAHDDRVMAMAVGLAARADILARRGSGIRD
jgi:hypothetical protein